MKHNMGQTNGTATPRVGLENDMERGSWNTTTFEADFGDIVHMSGGLNGVGVTERCAPCFVRGAMQGAGALLPLAFF